MLIFDKYKFARAIIIKRVLKERISLRELSKKIDVDFHYLSNYEMQLFKPREDNFLKICNWLKRKPDTFYKKS